MAELRGDEMKMSVPGDAGYEVSRFAEKSKSPAVLGKITEHQFHLIWTEAVGREGYDKHLFQEVLEALRNKGCISGGTTTHSPAVLGETVKPKVVCLCGSTRFTAQMLVLQWELTKQGIIVLSWCALPDNYFKGEDKTHIGDREGVKVVVDEVHKRKIDLADEVMVLNIGGYIGESTRSEINYAISKNKPVFYLEGK